MDRLVAAYEDLASKRFQVIADFEDPVQATLFRLEPAGDKGTVGVSTDNAQLRTGVGSLKVTFPSAKSTLVCGTHPDSQWGFPRDWSKYNLLLVSVYSAGPLGGFAISAQSGTDRPMRFDNPPLLLEPGWNLIRLDLTDMAEQIDLTDMRAIELRCESIEAPVEINLDDLILVDNSRDLFFTPERQPGDLYVRAVGRRLAVGAIDRFELVFSHGRIRQWFDLGFQKTRIHNLVGVGALGPNPSVVSGDETPTALVENAARTLGTGTTLETFQGLVHASVLRIMLQGEWRFTPPNAAPAEGDPRLRWVYSVYRDGRVYVECTGSVPGSDAARQVAFTFCCDATMDFKRVLAASSGSQGTDSAGRTGEDFLLFSRPAKGQGDLLVVPFKTPVSGQVADTSDARSCGSWLMNSDGGQFSFAAMLRVWPPDIDSPEQAAPMAADYRHPLPLQIDAGQLVRTDPGDFDNDGFSEARGYYVLQLDGNIAKIRIDGLRNLRFSPVFKLVDVANRSVWIYLDGRQIRESILDEDGNLIFMVPGVLSREVLLEITAQPAEAK